MTQQISNLESGGSVRAKLNEVISVANTVPDKIDKIPTAQPGNVAVWGENGVLIDSGAAPGGGQSANVPNWIDVRYDVLPIDYVVQYNSRLFSSKVDGNQNNEPPLEGENTYWIETSESMANGAPEYAPGTYLVSRAQVVKLNTVDNKYYQYILRATVPFISSNFDTELVAGNWQLLGATGGGASDMTVVNVDSATTTTHNATPNTIVLGDTTTALITCVVPNPTAGNSDLFAFKNVGTAHKLLVRTVSGTAIALLPSIDSLVEIKCNGTGYDILTDTRGLWRHEHVTASRDFTDDGLEDAAMYIYEVSTNAVMTLPPPINPSNSKAYQSHHELKGSGTVTFIRSDGGLIGSSNSVIIAISGTGFDIIEADGEYHIIYDSRPKMPNTSFTTYPLNEATAINDSVTGTTFLDRALSIDDPDFNKITPTITSDAVTAEPAAAWQQLRPSICPQGAIQGLVPEGTIDIFWNVYKTGGVDIDCYVGYFIRTAAGVETLLCNSNVYRLTSTTSLLVNLKAIHSSVVINPTDYLVVRRYVKKASTGSNPTFNSSVEGPTPTRSVIEVSAANISHETLAGRDGANQHPAGAISDTAPTGFTGTNQHDINAQFAAKIQKFSAKYNFAGQPKMIHVYDRAVILTSDIRAAGITDLRVGKNGATPVTIVYPYTIAANDVIEFSATYDFESTSYFTVKGTYND